MGVKRCRCICVVLIITSITSIYFISTLSQYRPNTERVYQQGNGKVNNVFKIENESPDAEIDLNDEDKMIANERAAEMKRKAFEGPYQLPGKMPASVQNSIFMDKTTPVNVLTDSLIAHTNPSQGHQGARVEDVTVLKHVNIPISKEPQQSAKDKARLKSKTSESRRTEQQLLPSKKPPGMEQNTKKATAVQYPHNFFGSRVQVTNAPMLNEPQTVKYGKDIVEIEQPSVPQEKINFPPLPKLNEVHFNDASNAKRTLNKHTFGPVQHSNENIPQNTFLTTEKRQRDLRNLSRVEYQLAQINKSMQQDRLYQQRRLSDKKRHQNQLHGQMNVNENIDPSNDQIHTNGRNLAVRNDVHHGINIDQQTGQFHMTKGPVSVLHNQISSMASPPSEENTLSNVAHPSPLAANERLLPRNKLVHGAKTSGFQLAKKGQYIGEYDNVDVRSQHVFLQNSQYMNVQTNETKALGKVKTNPLDVDTDFSPVTTKPSTSVDNADLNIPLKYENLQNGDLTVHNKPSKEGTNKKIEQPETSNVSDIKVEDIKGENNKTLTADVQATTVSKEFLQSLTDENLNDENVTEVTKHHFVKPTDIKTFNEKWQVQDNEFEIFLYSAYLDDRPVFDRKMVRLIGIAHGDLTDPHCILWYDDQKEPDVAIADLTKIGAKIQPVDAVRQSYVPYIFTCPLKENKGPPSQVSMITPSQIIPTTLLEVQIPVKPAPGEQIEIGQCMSVTYWYHDPVKVAEWLEIHRIWGVGEITVYGDELSVDTVDVFKHYAKEGFVDYREMPNIKDDDGEFVILLNMSPAINDCLYRNMYRYKKIMCTDVDEMIVPRSAANYTEMLAQILETGLKGTEHLYPSFMFRNVYFFTDFGPVEEEPWFLTTQRYLKHIKPSEYGYSVKSITDPQNCIALQNHLCWKRVDSWRWSIDVPLRLGRNHHYKKCHFDKYLVQYGACKRLMKEYYVDRNIERFGEELYNNTALKLIDLKIAEPA